MSGNDVKAKIDSGEPYTIRFKMPRAEDVKFHDEIRGWVKFDTKDLDDKVIWKSSDGLPTYHLANVIDDHLMEITHIIRGEEWVSSTPLHVLLYRAFGWELPIFAHLPLILGDDSKKLGKRHGDKYGYPIFPLTWDYVTKEGESVHVTGFRDEGYEPDALLNFLVLLGWNPKTNDEIMSIKDMAKLFSLEGVNKSGAMFDKKKLVNFNSHYLRSRDADSILSEMTDMPEDFLLSMDHDKLDLIASMAVERVEFSYELKDSLSYIYNTPILEDEIKMKNVEEFIKVMNVFAADDFMSNFDEDDWTPKNIRYELEHISGNMSIGVGKIMPMLRVAICGGASGPQLPDVMYVIGSKETKARIEALLNKIKELA
jgi:glutamyl-tRNA synthetase